MADPTPVTLQSLAPWGSALPDPQRLLTADELLNMGEDAHDYELIAGRLVQMAPTGGEHGDVAMEFGMILRQFVKQHHLGTVLAAETGFVISKTAQGDTVLAPDVAFVQVGREPPKGSPERKKFWQLVPDLVIEVASPAQKPAEMAAKAQQWLVAGTCLLWVVWPETQRVEVWRPQTPMLTLKPTDLLDGYTVLPGFSHPVRDLFA